MHTRYVSSHALTVVASGLVLALGLLLVPGQARAQDMAAAAHPAHIHSGSCAELGDVVHPLMDVTADTGTPVASPVAEMDHDMGTPEASNAMASPAADSFGTDITTSETIVTAPLADLAAGGYAINVHESAENIGNYIACGDIAAAAADSGDVSIALATLNDSGYMGTATLHDNGDDTTTVTITLMQREM